MLGLCPLAWEGLGLSLDWDRAGTEGGKLGEAVMGMTRLCKFYPCSSVGSSVLVN